MGVTSIYVLQLEGGKYYVGKTTDLPKRLKEHQQGRACSWTRQYRYEDFIEAHEMTSGHDEDDKVKKMMAKHGIDNVRGGSYCQVVLPETTVKVLETELRSAHDQCYLCGESGHLSNQCPKRKGTQNSAPQSCRGFTSKGARCQRTTYLSSNGYCPSHRDQQSWEDEPRVESSRENRPAKSRQDVPQTCRGFTLKGARCQITKYLNSDGYCPSHRDQQSGEDESPAKKPRQDFPQMCRGFTSKGARCQRTKYLSSSWYCPSHRHHQSGEGEPHYESDSTRSENGDNCHRCGRSGHWAHQCYARSDVYGNTLG